MKQQNEIKKLFEKYILLWNKHDIISWGQLFTEDTVFITWSGVIYKNNSENIKLHLKAHHILSKHKQNMTYDLNILDICFIHSNIAIVYTTWVWEDFKTEDSHTETRTGILTMMLLKRSGRWLIRTTQNTRTLVNMA